MFLEETKKIQNPREVRLSKLKNKRTQLENLLRSQQRLEYEIKNLKRSLAKDQKQLLKEEQLWQAMDTSKILTESRLLSEQEESEPFSHQTEVLDYFQAYSEVLSEIHELLFVGPQETPKKH